MDTASKSRDSRERRDPFTAAHWNSRDIALTMFAAPLGSRSVADLARELFGRELQPREWPELVGAPDQSVVHVAAVQSDVNGARDGIQIHLNHYWLEATAVRVAFRDSTGLLAIFNDFLFVRADAPPGVGTRLLALQVRMAVSLGVEYLVTDAAGGPGSTFVGYRVWPRLGFAGAIPDAVRRKLAARPPDHPLRSAHDVLDLVSRPGGREWWRVNGASFRGFFDLREASASRLALQAYTRERGIAV